MICGAVAVLVVAGCARPAKLPSPRYQGRRQPQSAGRQYAALHARTRQALAGVITDLYQRAGQPPPCPPQEMAQMILVVEAGIRLEQAAEPGDAAPPAAFERLRDCIEPAAGSGDGAHHAGRPT